MDRSEQGVSAVAMHINTLTRRRLLRIFILNIIVVLISEVLLLESINVVGTIPIKIVVSIVLQIGVVQGFYYGL